MNVSEIMTTDVQVISPDDTLQSAAKLMQEEDFGILPVCENEKLVGLLTDRDITTRAAAKGLTLDQAKVSDAMTSETSFIFEDQTVEYAATYMNERQVRRLPVLNRENQLVGIVSLADLALHQTDAATLALDGISQPS